MKRDKVPFDKTHFEKLKNAGNNLSTQETFEEIYKTNHWSGNASISGQGSDTSQTEYIVTEIPKLLKEFDVRSILDVPCGDFNWFNQIPLKGISYTGGDIVSEVIQKNNPHFSNENVRFIEIDLIRDELPTADLIFCRDCLVHLSNDDILSAIKNIQNSNIKYLLTTTFPECDTNHDITTGDWRVINLQNPPFNFPAPIRIINEKCTEGNGTYADKSLGLWRIEELLQ